MPPLLRRLWRSYHHHVYLAAITLLVCTNLLSFFGGVVAHDRVVALGGALFSHHKRVAAERTYVLKGAAASPAYSLAPFMPPTLQQGQTLACGAFAVSEALYAEMVRRGEIPPALSPWWVYYGVTGGANVGTSLDDEARSAEGRGSVSYSAMPAFGGPPAGLAPRAYGGAYEYLFYQPAGASGLEAIKGAIASGHPVVLLLQVRSEFYNDFAGQSTSGNTGSYQFNHFVVADGYSPAGIEIQNSWGSGFGVGGKITLTYQAVLDDVLAAGILHPGAIGWPAERPTATATPLPTKLTPLATKVTPLPTKQPTPRPTAAAEHTVFRLIHAQQPRLQPNARSGRLPLVPAGRYLGYAGRRTPHWVRLVVARHPRLVLGWFLGAHVRCSKGCRLLRP